MTFFKILVASLFVICFFVSPSFADVKCHQEYDGSTKCVELDNWGREKSGGVRCSEDYSGDTVCKELNTWGRETNKGVRCSRDYSGDTVCKELRGPFGY
ncbi:MAG: hypothetical protein LBE27_08425 [Deltaproteobacteria bacterium]|jgi:hypothetical protein|nr:hypothetical protein [Deltaproteobacteria bacterium]